MGAGLLVGAEAWEHPGWDGLFYPDDLPPEWRLTYYANEFPLVLLPAAAWCSTQPTALEDWRDDVPERFRFVLDVTGVTVADRPILQQLANCQATLGESLAGVVSRSPLDRAGRDLLRSELDDARFLAEAVTVPGLDELVRVAEDQGVCCALIMDGTGHDLKWLRGVLEQLSGRLQAETSPLLFFSGDPPPVDLLRDATVLWQLLEGLRP